MNRNGPKLERWEPEATAWWREATRCCSHRSPVTRPHWPGAHDGATSTPRSTPVAAQTGVVTAVEVMQRCDTTHGTVHTVFSMLRRLDANWASLRKRGYALAACPRCGSHNRRPAEIAELEGLLCWGCEHDEAGVHWPLETYGRFLVRL